MTDHWKDVHECWRLVRRGVGYRDQRVYIADTVDAARAKDAEALAAKDAEIASLEVQYRNVLKRILREVSAALRADGVKG